MPPLVKVCVLGSTGVGKSKFIEQFLSNRFDDQYDPTSCKGELHHCPLMLNGNLYQLKIIDMPAIKEFPPDPVAEWSEYQQCLLRNAHAYIMVFDLTIPATFSYIKALRDQLFESRNMQNVPVWIIGNKADLCLNVLATMRSHRYDHHQHAIMHPTQHQVNSPYDDIVPAFKDFANLVRKQWKCSYIECSAKYNWRVLSVFREIMKNLESSLQNEDSQSHHHGDYKDTQLRSSIKVAPLATSNDTNLTSRSGHPNDTNLTNGSHTGNSVCNIC